MQTEVTRLKSYLIQVNVKESGVELEKAKKQVIERIRNEGRVKGFKKGSAIPDAVIVREYGEEFISNQALDVILDKGKRMELVSIGNHCLGTKFLDGNHLINEKLTASFDRISKQVNGFYFGRYDLRCASLADLENGKIKIMELNGCGAEPAHIYHPGASLVKAMKVLITHWKNMYRISVENHKQGVPYLTLREGRAIYKKVKALKSAQ